MFSTDLNGSAWGRRRRGWATLFSFLLQCVSLALLMLAPVLFPHVLPRLNAAPPLINLLASAPDRPPVDTGPAAGGHHTSQTFNDRILIPTSYPTRPQIVDDEDNRPTSPWECTNCPPGASGSGAGANIAILFGPAPIPILKPSSGRVRVSVMSEGQILRRVQPLYPAPARSMRIQGPVVLQAIISKQGTIEHLQVISGHPMLVQAALDAVSQRRYRPYVLNGEAVEVETQVTVNFVLSGS